MNLKEAQWRAVSALEVVVRKTAYELTLPEFKANKVIRRGMLFAYRRDKQALRILRASRS